MIELGLPKIPNRTPTKITIEIYPELADALRQYADAYGEVYVLLRQLATSSIYAVRFYRERSRIRANCERRDADAIGRISNAKL